MQYITKKTYFIIFTSKRVLSVLSLCSTLVFPLVIAATLRQISLVLHAVHSLNNALNSLSHTEAKYLKVNWIKKDI